MKVRRILCCILAMVMIMCSATFSAFAATVEEVNVEETTTTSAEMKFIPLEVTEMTVEMVEPRASRVSLGANASGNFTYSGLVTVTIPDGIISYSANQVGIIVVDRTSGATGDVFRIECINKPFHNSVSYTVGNTNWTYYNLAITSASGGDSLTFKATWIGGNNSTHQFELIAGLFYYG